MSPYNHTISQHVNIPKQPITTAAPRPPLPISTPFTPPFGLPPPPVVSPPDLRVGEALMEFVGLGRLFVKPGAVTAVGKEAPLLRLANWLVASALSLAYIDTISVVKVRVEVGWLTGAMYVMK